MVLLLHGDIHDSHESPERFLGSGSERHRFARDSEYAAGPFVLPSVLASIDRDGSNSNQGEAVKNLDPPSIDCAVNARRSSLRQIIGWFHAKRTHMVVKDLHRDIRIIFRQKPHGV